jgi:hypothetical protein
MRRETPSAAADPVVLGSWLPAMILIDDYPQLTLLAWNRKVRVIAEEEALALYEAHPQWVDRATMGEHERAFLDGLVARYAKGVWLG